MITICEGVTLALDNDRPRVVFAYTDNEPSAALEAEIRAQIARQCRFSVTLGRWERIVGASGWTARVTSCLTSRRAP